MKKEGVPPRGHYSVTIRSVFLLSGPALRSTTQISPVPTWPGLGWGSAEDEDPPQGGQENSLINTVGSRDDPHGGDDGPSAQVVALELQAGLPGPLSQQGHVATHDAWAGARPQTADCRARGRGRGGSFGRSTG